MLEQNEYLEFVRLENNVLKLVEQLSRDTKAIPCSICNGYCDSVETTKKEIKEHDCGKGYQCCSKAFECRICHKRIIALLDAPEMND